VYAQKLISNRRCVLDEGNRWTHHKPARAAQKRFIEGHGLDEFPSTATNFRVLRTDQTFCLAAHPRRNGAGAPDLQKRVVAVTANGPKISPDAPTA
jgi:hypothetical protein